MAQDVPPPGGKPDPDKRSAPRRKAKGGGEDRIVIKKYANRRLYNTGSSSYVTLEDLAELVKAGDDFVVFDAKTGEDITRPVLTQIIFEAENSTTGQNLLPIQFLRQLIRLYGDQMQSFVPSYLEMSLDAFSKQQERMREQMAGTFAAAPGFGLFDEQVKQNLALFDRAIKMFTPRGRLHRPSRPGGGAGRSVHAPPHAPLFGQRRGRRSGGPEKPDGGHAPADRNAGVQGLNRRHRRQAARLAQALRGAGAKAWSCAEMTRSQDRLLPVLVSAPQDSGRQDRIDAGASGASIGGGAGPSNPYAAQMAAQTGARRGLRGGAPVLEAARSAYLGAEYSGEHDRRPPSGLLVKTAI